MTDTDWHIVSEAVQDSIDNADGNISAHSLEMSFKRQGLIVSHADDATRPTEGPATVSVEGLVEARRLANEARWESFNSRTDCDQAREFAAWSWVDKLCDALLGKSQGL